MSGHPELRDHLEAYLAVREALGFNDAARRTLLRSFVEYAITTDRWPIDAQLALDWACGPSSVRSAAGQASRLSAVRRFLCYLRASVPETQVPGSGLIARQQRRKPYIFTQEELTRLLDAAAAMRPRRKLRPHVYVSMIGLLASTGLRAGEAIRLTVDDVRLDIDPPRILVLETKFRKSRIVPVHPTAAEKLKTYALLRRRLGYAGLSDLFFMSEIGTAISYGFFATWFTRTARRLGMSPPLGARAPTLHSLRHTFAVERLTQWFLEGVPVQQWAPNLSVYLGHVSPVETYWYLTATPALLAAAAAAFGQYANLGDTR
ncbi:tyrosine-type recombinase/integrase [Cupriavidus oxalaticus]|uniref:Integrase n=1 Tax=Cupriavidus oxalaticus TaxID=96344 RepID=A0A5P3VUR3_9BURK|nr:tyrosine-type recombinase/integrase [Cupriavidus oxalaticus]QEZ49011.1 integrase [Cupriavidus oxalaticus]